MFSDNKNNKSIDKNSSSSLNMILTIDAASATISGVKRAYQTILLNVDAILPEVFKESLNKYSSCRLVDRDGWASELATFDELMKIQKQKQLALAAVKEEKRKSKSNSSSNLNSNSSSMKSSGSSSADSCGMRAEISVGDKVNNDGAFHVGKSDVKSLTSDSFPSSSSPSNSCPPSSSPSHPLSATCPLDFLPCSSDIARNRSIDSTHTAIRATNTIQSVTTTANIRLLREKEMPASTHAKSCRAEVVSPTDFPIPPGGTVISTSSLPSANPNQTHTHTLTCTGNIQILDFVKIKDERDSFSTNYCKIGQSDMKISNGNYSNVGHPIDNKNQENRLKIDKKRYFEDEITEKRKNQILCPKMEQKKLQKIST